MTEDQIYEIVKLALGALASMVTVVGVVVGAFVKHLHGKGMNELGEIKEAIVDSKVTNAVHDERLNKIDVHQKVQDETIHKLKGEIHYVRNKMVTPDHVQLMIEASK